MLSPQTTASLYPYSTNKLTDFSPATFAYNPLAYAAALSTHYPYSNMLSASFAAAAAAAAAATSPSSTNSFNNLHRPQAFFPGKLSSDTNNNFEHNTLLHF
jgi:hypothetical protein